MKHHPYNHLTVVVIAISIAYLITPTTAHDMVSIGGIIASTVYIVSSFNKKNDSNCMH